MFRKQGNTVNLPNDERQLLAGYARLIGRIGETKVYRISALRPLLTDCQAEVNEYPEYDPSDELGEPAGAGWVKQYIAETERIKTANTHLAARNLITLIPHQHELDVVVVGVTLAGYDLGREFVQLKSAVSGESASMDILLSWSKSKSKQLARELYKWLPNVLPGVKPWMSEKDIDKGTEWFGELQAYLGQAKACIIVVTEENVRSPWLYYEAGAIAAKGPDVRVCPYLVGIEPGMLADGPLGKFQGTVPTLDDTLALIYSLNRRLGSPHNEQLLKHAVDVNWHTLEAEITRMQGLPPQNPADFIRTPADELAGLVLSTAATMLLLEAAEDRQGIVIVSADLSGVTISTNGKAFNQQGNPRSEAEWTQAVKELAEQRLLEQRGEEIYELTDKGYKLADKRKGQPQARQLDENDIVSLLEGHLASHRDELPAMTFRFDEMESQLRLPAGSATKHIDKAAETLGHRVRRKGGNVVTFDVISYGPSSTNFDGKGRPIR
jgi:hypothetical protein